MTTSGDPRLPDYRAGRDHPDRPRGLMDYLPDDLKVMWLATIVAMMLAVIGALVIGAR